MNSEELKERNIQNVIAKTLECFELYGIEATTMGMIAERAELTTRSIQRYFHSKENLTLYALQVFLKEMYRQFQKEFKREMVHTKDGLEQLVLCLRLLQRYLKTNFKDMNDINEIENYLFRNGIDTKVMKDYINMVTMIRQMVLDAIRRGQKDESIRSDINGELAGDTILGAYVGLMHRIYTYKKYKYSPYEIVEVEQMKMFEQISIDYLRAK